MLSCLALCHTVSPSGVCAILSLPRLVLACSVPVFSQRTLCHCILPQSSCVTLICPNIFLLAYFRQSSSVTFYVTLVCHNLLLSPTFVLVFPCQPLYHPSLIHTYPVTSVLIFFVSAFVCRPQCHHLTPDIPCLPRITLCCPSLFLSPLCYPVLLQSLLITMHCPSLPLLAFCQLILSYSFSTTPNVNLLSPSLSLCYLVLPSQTLSHLCATLS